MGKIFLFVAGGIWLAYGGYLIIWPEALAPMAGVQATSTTGTIELRATYGGLLAGVGVLAIAAGLAPALRRSGLAALAFLSTGVGGARFVSAVIAGEFSRYTIQGLTLELLLAIIAVWLLRADLARSEPRQTREPPNSILPP